MEAYRISETEVDLSQLIERAAGGQQVLITRDGEPVAELRPLAPSPLPATAAVTIPAERAALMDWLRERRESRPSMPMTAVELMDEMYAEDER